MTKSSYYKGSRHFIPAVYQSVLSFPVVKEEYSDIFRYVTFSDLCHYPTNTWDEVSRSEINSPS